MPSGKAGWRRRGKVCQQAGRTPGVAIHTHPLAVLKATTAPKRISVIRHTVSKNKASPESTPIEIYFWQKSLRFRIFFIGSLQFARAISRSLREIGWPRIWSSTKWAGLTLLPLLRSWEGSMDRFKAGLEPCVVFLSFVSLCFHQVFSFSNTFLFWYTCNILLVHFEHFLHCIHTFKMSWTHF